MRKSLIVFITASLCSMHSFSAYSQNYCDSVLNTKAFNTYNYDYQRNLNSKAASLMCELHISNRQKLDTSSKSTDAGGQYGAISGFFDSAQASSNLSVEEIYDRVCNQHDSSFVDNVFESKHTQITDRNVDAWSKCVSSTGVIAALMPSADNKTFTIQVRYTKDTKQASPLALKLAAIDPSHGFKCDVSGKDIKGLVPEKDLDISTASFGISCVRASANTDNQIVINTNVEDIGPFTVPSEGYLTLSQRLDRLENELSKESSTQSGKITNLVNQLNAQFQLVGPADGEAHSGVNVHGGGGLPKVDCGAHKFLNTIHLTADSSDNLNVYTQCRELPVLQITPP